MSRWPPLPRAACKPMIANTAHILGIELLAAALGHRFLRPLKSSTALEGHGLLRAQCKSSNGTAIWRRRSNVRHCWYVMAHCPASSVPPADAGAALPASGFPPEPTAQTANSDFNERIMVKNSHRPQHRRAGMCTCARHGNQGRHRHLRLDRLCAADAGKEGGLFKKHGLDVTIKKIPQKDRHLAIASVTCNARRDRRNLGRLERRRRCHHANFPARQELWRRRHGG